MHDSQRPQSLDPTQLTCVKVVELFITLNELTKLPFLLMSLAAEKHPHILNGRPHHAVVEVDKMSRVISPENIPGVAVTVNTLLIALSHTGQYLARQ